VSRSDSNRGFLGECHPLLQAVFARVALRVPIVVLPSTVRTQEEQEEFVESGRSQTMDSLHLPQDDGWVYAVDAAPHPIVWPDPEAPRHVYAKQMGRFYMFVGYVKATADALDVSIRSGADWDGDWRLRDQSFDDLVHFELGDRHVV
jgi:peptidoglycan L-alanyl-D-glutamate endopeptidase CwlK